MRSGARDHENDTNKRINIPITVRYVLISYSNYVAREGTKDPGYEADHIRCQTNTKHNKTKKISLKCSV